MHAVLSEIIAVREPSSSCHAAIQLTSILQLAVSQSWSWIVVSNPLASNPNSIDDGISLFNLIRKDSSCTLGCPFYIGIRYIIHLLKYSQLSCFVSALFHFTEWARAQICPNDSCNIWMDTPLLFTSLGELLLIEICVS